MKFKEPNNSFFLFPSFKTKCKCDLDDRNRDYILPLQEMCNKLLFKLVGLQHKSVTIFNIN